MYDVDIGMHDAYNYGTFAIVCLCVILTTPTLQPQDLFLKFDPAKQGAITEPRNHRFLAAALTVHPVSEPRQMFRVHHRVLSSLLNATHERLRRLELSADRMAQLLPRSSLPGLVDGAGLSPPVSSREGIVPWALVNSEQLLRAEEGSPAVKLPESWRRELSALATKAVEHLNAREETEEGEELVFRRISNAYWKLEPSVGIRYVVDFEAVRRTAQADYLAAPKQFKVSFLRRLGAPEVGPQQLPPSDAAVSIAVALSNNQFAEFQSFVKRLEAVLEHTKRVNLFVVLMKATGERPKALKTSSVMDPRSILSLYESKYPHASFKVIDSPDSLSRARAIALVLHEVRPSEILFLSDVYLDFDASFVERCRSFPLQGQQVFFPILFARADPRGFSAANSSLLDGTVSASAGYWLARSASVACIYASDMLSVASDSAGKGVSGSVDMQEVYGAVMRRGYQVVRMPDWALQRVHTVRPCDADLNGETTERCGEGEEEEEGYDRLHLKTQLSRLFFDHEGEHAGWRF